MYHLLISILFINLAKIHCLYQYLSYYDDVLDIIRSQTVMINLFRKKLYVELKKSLLGISMDLRKTYLAYSKLLNATTYHMKDLKIFLNVII